MLSMGDPMVGLGYNFTRQMTSKPYLCALAARGVVDRSTEIYFPAENALLSCWRTVVDYTASVSPHAII
jgi:hypothetical protein